MSSLRNRQCPEALEKRCHEDFDKLGSDGLPFCNKEGTKTNSAPLLFLLQVATDPGSSTEKDSRTCKGEKPPGRPKFEGNTKSHFETEETNTLSSNAQDFTHSISPSYSFSSIPTAKSSVSFGYNPHDQRDQKTKKWVPKPTFAEKLMLVLSSPNTSHAIDWVPEGDSFFIVSSKLLVSDVLPRFFKEVKYESFTRKLNRWGFKKRIIKHRVDAMAYFHAKFLRENPDLCKQMRGGQKECTVVKSVALTEPGPVGASSNGVRMSVENVALTECHKAPGPVRATSDNVRSSVEGQRTLEQHRKAVPDPIRSSESIEKTNDVSGEVSNKESKKEWAPEEKFVPCYAPHGIDGNQQVDQQVELNSGSIVSPVTNPTPNPYGETISPNPYAKTISPNPYAETISLNKSPSPVTSPTPYPYGETISLDESPMSVSHINNENGHLSEYWNRKVSEILEIYQHKASFSQGSLAGGNSKKTFVHCAQMYPTTCRKFLPSIVQPPKQFQDNCSPSIVYSHLHSSKETKHQII